MAGVPVTIKINVDVAGEATTDGVAAFQDNIAASDSPLVQSMREAGAIRPKPQDETAVGEELRRYDQYMTQVRGLAPKTREGALRLVGALLRKHFGDGDIRFEVLTAEHVRHFFASQAKNCSTPSSLGAVVASLRGYFRWRASLGAVRYSKQDDVAQNEEPSDGYTLVDAHLAYRWDRPASSWEVFLDGSNLTDEEARPHTSLLRDYAPLPGRGVAFGIRAYF